MISAHAQDAPRVELFAGYAVTRVTFPISTIQGLPQGKATLQGWDVAANLNANRWVGIVVEAGAQYGNSTVITTFKPPNCVLCTQTVGATFHSVRTLLAGPQVSLARDKRISLFLHSLFGAGYSNEDGAFGNTAFSSTHFAMAAGGGVDIGFSRYFAVRAQPDYLMTRNLGHRADNLRFSTGVVFRFGQLSATETFARKR